MKSHEVIERFVDFYRDRGHRLITGSTLIPGDGDPVLFTTSGMHPLTPYLHGKPHPLGRGLVNVQRCLRTTDLDDVGDPWHLTVFEMLGVWSLGDYDEVRSVRWGFELLTDVFGLDPSHLHSTVYPGEDRTVETWTELGVPVEIGVEDNWWSNGPTGLCGPDTEMFFWTGDGEPTGTPYTDERWMEIGNHVSMRYHRHEDGRLTPLEQPNVDVGIGFERLLSVLQGVGSVFDLDLLRPWWNEVGRLWTVGDVDRRVVSDHLRSTVVIVGDGVRPSNTGRGYVLRRLLRRVFTILWSIDRDYSVLDLQDEPIRLTGEHFGVPVDVRPVWTDEERRFRDLVERGRRLVGQQPLTPQRLDYLRDTHGLPPDLVRTLVVDP